MRRVDWPSAHSVCRSGLALVAALIGAYAHAAIPINRFDLGAVPGSGSEAGATIDDRARIVVSINACGREKEFWDSVEDPHGDPYATLIAKAAFLAQRPRELCREQVPYGQHSPSVNDPPWIEPFTHQRWEAPISSQAKAQVLAAINGVFETRFGVACATAVTDIIDAPTLDDSALIEFALTQGCLRAQINTALMTRDRAGKNPGSAGLPCHVVGKAAEGDWDMAVYRLTRIVYLARAAPSVFTPDTRNKLDQLLTLSGPLQGESYGLYQCGNPDNTTGSAEERAAEADFYDDGFFDDIGDLAEWLLAFLAITLVFVAAALLLALAAGPALGPAGMLGAALLGATTGAALSLAINLVRIEETENHLLMINSSKYLMNRLIVEQLSDADDRRTFEGYNKDLEEWLLKRFKKIVEEDFVEYNSRPYQRLSLGAIMNIHDFANVDGNGSSELTTAAAAVLDLAAAKMALSSSQGRRIVPFRRLAGTNASFTYGPSLTAQNPQRLFDLAGGSDHLIAAMLLWAGQTQHTDEGRASLGAGGQMIDAATSSYRPHSLILDIAIDKSRPYEQRIHHDGWEHYSSGPGWLLSAGGTSTDYAQLALISPFSLPFEPPLAAELGFLKHENRGAGVPTTLMAHSATMRHDRYRDFLRFEGFVRVWDKADPADAQPISYDGNVCMDRGFACGIRFLMPTEVEACLQRPPGTPPNLSFIDSAACAPYAGAPRFFVVVYRQRCPFGFQPCNATWWGFIEVIDATPGQDLQSFAQATIQRNGNRFAAMRTAAGADGIKPVSYVSWRSGTILFDPDLPGEDDEATGILQIDGSPIPHSDLDNWGRADGDILTYTGAARVTIGRPLDPRRIEIDLSNWRNPSRVLPP